MWHYYRTPAGVIRSEAADLPYPVVAPEDYVELPPRRLVWHDFRDLLSTEKQLAIARAVRDDPRLLIFLLDAAAQGVDLDSPRTAGALDMLVASGLITGEERETLARGQSISATKAASR